MYSSSHLEHLLELGQRAGWVGQRRTQLPAASPQAAVRQLRGLLLPRDAQPPARAEGHSAAHARQPRPAGRPGLEGGPSPHLQLGG